MDAGRRWGLRTTDYALLVTAAAVLAVRVAMSHHYVGGFDCYVYWRGIRDLFAGVNPYEAKEFVTPPSGMVALLWMRLVDFDVAYVVMQFVTAAAIVVGGFVTLRRLTSLREPHAAAASMALTAVAMPAYTSIGFASLNGLIFLTFALAVAAMLDGRERRAGLWMGLGFALKPVLIPFWVMFVIQRRWRGALWSFVPVVAGSLVALAVNARVVHFVDQGLPNIVNGLQSRFARMNITVVAFAKTAGLPGAVGSAGRAAAAVLTVAVAFLLWQRYQTRRDAPALEWLDVGSVLFVGTLLVSSFAWRYYVLFLFPLFARALRRTALVSHPLDWAGALLATVPDGLGFRDARGLPRVFTSGRYTVGVGLVLVGVGLALWRDGAWSELGQRDAALVEPRGRVDG